MNLLLAALCFFSQVGDTQKELHQLKEKLGNVRKEIKQLEKMKVGTLTRIEKIDEASDLTVQYLEELTSQASQESIRVQELNTDIARLEAKMNVHQQDLQERLVRLYKWRPFYKMEVVFSSKSLPEILATAYYLQILAQEDQRAFDEFKSDWERYKNDRKLRENLIATIASRRKEKEEELVQLNQERAEKNKILLNIGKEESAKKQLEKELKSAQRKLEELIVSLEKQRKKTEVSTNVLEANRGKLVWPCKGEVTTKFGNVVHPKYNTITKNNGIDITSRYGDNVYAVAPGKVVYADRFMGYGNLVLIDHHDGFYSLYGHLADILAKVGDEVVTGRIIARIGESGSLSGPMLHFELRKNGTPVDPLAYLK